MCKSTIFLFVRESLMCAESLLQGYAKNVTEEVNANMLSQIPVKVEKVEKKLLDCEILRVAIIAELDAVNLYEQLVAATNNENIRNCLLYTSDAADE